MCDLIDSTYIFCIVKGGSPVQNYHKFKRKNKNFPTDWFKNDENRIRNKGSCDILKFPHFFGKHFLTSPYEYSNERVDDVMPSQFFHMLLYMKFRNFLIFSSYW